MEWNDPECFRQFVYQPSVSRSLLLSPLSHSLSLSFSLIFHARPASILSSTGGHFKTALEIFRVIRSNIFGHLREWITTIAEEIV